MTSKVYLPFFFFLFIGLHATAQKEKELELVLKKKFWTDCVREFKVTEVPTKFKNESAVIIANSYENTLIRENRWYVFRINAHFRIKLNDNASIKEYSELNFNNNKATRRASGNTSSYRQIGIKIVKANGTEKELDLTNSVSADYNSMHQNKIAVPDLEPGDILDYYIAVKQEYDAASLYLSDMSEMELMESKFPTMYKLLYYELPSSYNLYSYSYNGAPEFTKKYNSSSIICSLVDTMRQKSPSLQWDYPFRTSPEVRYRFSTSNGYSFKKNYEYKHTTFYQGLGIANDFMNKNFKSLESPNELGNEVYLMFRSPIYLNFYSNGAFSLTEPKDASNVSEVTLYHLADYLIKKKIQHDVLLIPRRDVGPFEKHIDANYIEMVIRITGDKPLYLSVPRPFQLPNEMPYIYEGMECAVYRWEEKFEYSAMPNEVIPISSPEQNMTNTEYELSLLTDNKIGVKRKLAVKGANKSIHQELIYTNYDYLKEYDKPIYEKYASVAIATIVKNFKTERNKFEQRKTQDYIERDKKIVSSIEEDLDCKISDYKNLTIGAIGMWPNATTTIYSDEFSIDNLVKKAGPNYIVEFGKLIEQQTKISDTNRIRTRDVYMMCPRSFEYNFTFTIPEGYTIDGIENFTKKVENDAGGFVSSAEVKDGKLFVKTKKYYSKNYYPSNKWNLVVEFLDASIDFYNTKLLLRKN